MYALMILSLLAPAPDATKDAAAIQGTWVIESIMDDGKPQDDIKGDRLTFKEGNITVKRKDEEMKATYKIDAAKDPKTIDIVQGDTKEEYAGIYQLDGDTLKICAPAKAGGKRPTELASKAGSGWMLLVLKREKK